MSFWNMFANLYDISEALNGKVYRNMTKITETLIPHNAKSLFSISTRADHAADFSPNDGNFSQEYCMYFKKNCLSVAEKMQVRCAWRDTKQALR